jgi:hypothetical protein
MFPVYPLRGIEQSPLMDDDPKSKRRWGSTGYIVLIVIAVLIAVCILRPLGQSLTNPFQAIGSALSAH